MPTGRTYLPNFAHKNPLLKNSLLQFWISANWTQAMHWLFQCRSFAWTPKRNPQYLEDQRQQQHYQLQHKHQQNERHDIWAGIFNNQRLITQAARKKVRLSVSFSDNVACLVFRRHRGFLCLHYSPTKSSEGPSLRAAKHDSLAKIRVFLWYFARNKIVWYRYIRKGLQHLFQHTENTLKMESLCNWIAESEKPLQLVSNAEFFCKSGKFLQQAHHWLKNFRIFWKMSGYYTKYDKNVAFQKVFFFSDSVEL